jgi:hypothetical protein
MEAKNENDFIFYRFVAFGRIISAFCGNVADWLRAALGNYSGLLSGRCGYNGKIKAETAGKNR